MPTADRLQRKAIHLILWHHVTFVLAV